MGIKRFWDMDDEKRKASSDGNRLEKTTRHPIYTGLIYNLTAADADVVTGVSGYEIVA